MNELLLQRCVDGELSAEERSGFLESLGDDVANWKQFACRLLADRELAAACRDWMSTEAAKDPVTNRITTQVADGPHVHGQNGHAVVVRTLPVNRLSVVDAMNERPRRGSKAAWLQRSWVPIVAGVLGIALGLVLSAINRSDSAIDVTDGSSDRESDTDSVVSEVPQAPPFSTVRFTVNSEEGPRSLELPVVGSGDLRTLAAMESSIDPELREQLLRQGYQLQETTGLITLPIDDATRVAVPVQAVQMRHVGL